MWPHGTKPNHHYCGAGKAENSSYCTEHRAMSVRDFDIEPRQPFIPNRKAA
jgi:hypothetical protein